MERGSEAAREAGRKASRKYGEEAKHLTDIAERLRKWCEEQADDNLNGGKSRLMEDDFREAMVVSLEAAAMLCEAKENDAIGRLLMQPGDVHLHARKALAQELVFEISDLVAALKKNAA